MNKIIRFSIPFIAGCLMLGMLIYLAEASSRATPANPYPATGGPNAHAWNTSIRYVSSTILGERQAVSGLLLYRIAASSCVTEIK